MQFIEPIALQGNGHTCVRNRRRRESLDRDSILTIIYTSGTTGRPKGVVLTHGNMLYEAEVVHEQDVVRTDDVQLLFLPMAHVFAKMLEVAWFATGHVLAFAESINTIKDNLQEVRPTLMAGVPRVFEKFYGAVVEKGSSLPPGAGLGDRIKQRLFTRALELSAHQRRGGGHEASRNESNLQPALRRGLGRLKHRDSSPLRLG